MTAYSTGEAILYTEEEKAGIRKQLDRLLRNTYFSQSKRFPSFLRFIVQEELEGRSDLLKERTLGIEVFGREAGYDTTSDPIVRVTAAEIRRRIAQYYQEPGHELELRIALPLGSYIPRFEWPPTEPVSTTVPDVLKETDQPIATPTTQSTTRWLLVAGVALLAMLSATGWYFIHSRPSTLDRFWAPMLGSRDPVVVCFPQSHFDGITLRNAADPTQQRQLQEKMSAVLVDDLQPLVSLSGLLDMRHQPYILMGEDTTTLTDLRRGPAIFLGAFDNAWTLRVTRGLRFRFGDDAAMTHFWIEDTQSPTRAHWEIDRNLQEATNNYRDYAIVARFADANTGKPAVIAAGIARGGTVAAGEFLTQPANMDLIKAQAPKNWDGQNMEFVLSTEIIDGRSSPPKVEATYFW
ncbi:hypothetical protein [Granulicella sp. S156]|uniref:hypothetical protein n=1 Tax=Granulicella sp. S156 TaxID=1747224 RepID=UPI00131C42F3|nr:hypothetical protein [Granulicella sp. S156]